MTSRPVIRRQFETGVVLFSSRHSGYFLFVRFLSVVSSVLKTGINRRFGGDVKVLNITADNRSQMGLPGPQGRNGNPQNYYSLRCGSHGSYSFPYCRTCFLCLHKCTHVRHATGYDRFSVLVSPTREFRLGSGKSPTATRRP